MEIKIMDGKKELVFRVNSCHKDGTPLDFNNPEHRQRFNNSCVEGIQSLGYICKQTKQGEFRVAQ